MPKRATTATTSTTASTLATSHPSAAKGRHAVSISGVRLARWSRAALVAATITATREKLDRWLSVPTGVLATSASTQTGTNARPAYAGHVRPDNAHAPSQAAIVASPSAPETDVSCQPSPGKEVWTTLERAGKNERTAIAAPHVARISRDRGVLDGAAPARARRSAPLNSATATPTRAHARPVGRRCPWSLRVASRARTGGRRPTSVQSRHAR